MLEHEGDELEGDRDLGPPSQAGPLAAAAATVAVTGSEGDPRRSPAAVTVTMGRPLAAVAA